MSYDRNTECENCGFLLVQEFSFCPRCGRPLGQIAAPVASKKAPVSLPVLAKDSTKWYLPAFDAFPSVIAHEYWRLRMLCEQDKPYGALIQVKDLLETVIKFEILAAVAWAMQEAATDSLLSIVSQITTPAMSLGKWCAFGREIKRYFDDHPSVRLPEPLKEPLFEILTVYEKKTVVHWRNQKIGHGALGFSEDKEFQNDIRDKVQLFRELFQKIGRYLAQQALYAADTELKGFQMARRLANCEALSMRFCDGTVVCLDPYIRLMEDTDAGNGKSAEANRYGIYFYDNQNDRVRRSEMLSYPSGRRKHVQIGYFLEMSARRSAAYEPDISKSIADRYKTSEEESLLNQISLSSMETEFVQPNALVRRLQKAIGERSRGVFLLTMPRGTGKSTFAEKLNSLNHSPMVLDDALDVRTYHMSRSQLLSADDFEASVESLWEYAYHQPQWSSSAMPRIYRYRASGMSEAEALTAFLGECVQYTRKVREKKRIMMVFDGLDEIVDGRIWSYLCIEPDSLPEGVYILLTSRCAQDMQADKSIPQEIYRRINSLACSEQIAVERTDADYIGFLDRYIESAGITGLLPEQRQKLLQRADYRVLYLGMICKLLSSGLQIDEIGDARHLVRLYLRTLTDCYGEKETYRLKELLAVLCTFGEYEPLSLREIADLTWNNGVVSVDLLGKMNDLSPLLKAYRGFSVHGQSYTGITRYTFANSDLTNAFRELIDDTRRIVVENVETTLSYLCESTAQAPDDPADASYRDTVELVASQMFGILDRPVLEECLRQHEGWPGRLIAYAKSVGDSPSLISSQRAEQMLTGCMAFLDGEQVAEKAAVCYALAELAMLVGQGEKALDSIARGIQALGTDQRSTADAQIRVLAFQILKAGVLLKTEQRYAEAEQVAQAACNELKALLESGRNDCALSLAQGYMLLASIEEIKLSSRNMPLSSYIDAHNLLWYYRQVARYLEASTERPFELYAELHESVADLFARNSRIQKRFCGQGRWNGRVAADEYGLACDALDELPLTVNRQLKKLSLQEKSSSIAGEEKASAGELRKELLRQYEDLDDRGLLTDRTRLFRLYIERLRSGKRFSSAFNWDWKKFDRLERGKTARDSGEWQSLLSRTAELYKQLDVQNSLTLQDKADFLSTFAVAYRYTGQISIERASELIGEAISLYARSMGKDLEAGFNDAQQAEKLSQSYAYAQSLVFEKDEKTEKKPETIGEVFRPFDELRVLRRKKSEVSRKKRKLMLEKVMSGVRFAVSVPVILFCMLLGLAPLAFMSIDSPFDHWGLVTIRMEGILIAEMVIAPFLMTYFGATISTLWALQTRNEAGAFWGRVKEVWRAKKKERVFSMIRIVILNTAWIGSVALACGISTLFGNFLQMDKMSDEAIILITPLLFVIIILLVAGLCMLILNASVRRAYKKLRERMKRVQERRETVAYAGND